MFSCYFKNIISNYCVPCADMDLLPYFKENTSLQSEDPIKDDSYFPKEESLIEINDDFSSLLSSKQFENPLAIPSNEEEGSKEFIDLIIGDINNSIDIESKKDSLPCCENLEKEGKKRYFQVVYPIKESLFTNAKKNNNYNKKQEFFLKRKRLQFRRQRMDNKDNIRKKIKRGFFNATLTCLLNEKLKSIGSSKYFMKFPQYFVVDIDRGRNKKVFSMTLKEIFEKKELYKREIKRGLNNYLHNFKVVQNEDIKNNEEFKIILNKTIRELYEEYINSDEFKIREINRLKKKNMKDDYLKRYIYLANHLFEFFSKKI